LTDRSRTDFKIIEFNTQIGPPNLTHQLPTPTGYNYRENSTDVKNFTIRGRFLDPEDEPYPAYIIVNSYHVGDSRHEIVLNGAVLENISAEPNIPYNDVTNIPTSTATRQILNFTSYARVIPKERLNDNSENNPFRGKNTLQIRRTTADDGKEEGQPGGEKGRNDAFYISYCIVHWIEKD
jgi:hypothetical protein